MAYCPSCGKEVQPELAFCGFCGHKLAAPAPAQAASHAATVSAMPPIHLYKAPIVVATILIGLVLMGIGAGVYAIPGYNQAYTYCAYGYGPLGQLCNQGRSMIVGGVVLALVGLIVLIFAGFWYARKSSP
ncbi:MAG: zinc-ribbon domain-containing protein [Nitrososphaerota archaeon]|nr:zinc-ribbon domain-containing protein [Nitrososphaerota archaeon]